MEKYNPITNSFEVIQEGGPGSGNFGHGGRPGEIGGSSEGGRAEYEKSYYASYKAPGLSSIKGKSTQDALDVVGKHIADKMRIRISMPDNTAIRHIAEKHFGKMAIDTFTDDQLGRALYVAQSGLK